MRSRCSQQVFSGRIPGRSGRRGFTLIQMLMVISVSGVLMGLAVAWIHQVLHFSSSIRQRQRHHAGMVQLADQLRNDIRISSGMSLNGENELMLESAGGVETRYVLSSGWVSVEKKRGSELLMQDRFELAPNAIAQWTADEMPDWVTLVIFRGRTGPGDGALSEANATPAMEPAPIDLHLRVGTNRWPAILEK